MKSTTLKLSAAFLLFFSSCIKDLDREPFYEQTSVAIYKDPANYIHVLAKLYAGLAVTGQAGPAGNADIPTSVLDEGFSQYMRVFWKLQELPTDEAKCRWNDVGIPDLGKWTWSDANQWIRGGYLRFLYQVTSCNEFIKQTKDELLDDRGFSETDKARIRVYRAEARFLRALSLFHALDIFRNIPDLTDENRFPGSEFPDQMSPKALFKFIETELLAIENQLGTRNTVEYGRANQACAQTLLAKLYLNAEAMIKENHYAKALNYCEKVITTGGYSLETRYTNLFRADNHLSNEIIFPINSDGTRTLSYGLTTFLVNASGFLTTQKAALLFTEPVGTTISGEVSVNDHTFVADSLNYSSSLPNPSKVTSAGSAAAGEYKGASSGASIIFSADTVKNLTIGAIKTLNLAGLKLQFGWRKSSAASLPAFKIEYSTNNGGSWDSLQFTLPNKDADAVKWYLSREIALPASCENLANLSIRFTNSGKTGLQLDDIKLSHSIYSGWGSSFPSLSVVDTTGSTEAWQGLIATKELYNRFADSTKDSRFQFLKAGRTADITVLPGTSALINEGIVVKKFRNLTSLGSPGSNVRFADTDFPLFRLADVFLMYAEAHLRGGGGSLSKAVDYFNELRERAYGNKLHNVTSLNLDDILEERSRELYWEGYRRTDLIRFNKFTGGSFIWSWKGNAQNGAATPDFLRIYPLPATELTANPKLRQNEGY
jgi:hypothetical protein